MSAGKNAMLVQYGIERLPGGDRLVKTVGLARMGQRVTMPIGSAAAFDNKGATVFPAGKDAGRRDPGDPYAVEPGRRSLD